MRVAHPVIRKILYHQMSGLADRPCGIGAQAFAERWSGGKNPDFIRQKFNREANISVFQGSIIGSDVLWAGFRGRD